ncbi:MAG: ArgR family transcriptional regulator [Ruminococcus sp.]|nr:ArgR family transcriptional regulator [Ruminococcus sp.]
MKERRLNVILDLISEHNIDRQEDLLLLLNERGFNVTQATVSRDIKALRLIKAHDENGVYRYTQPTINTADNKIFDDTIVSVDYAINTVVLKCKTGMAQAVCAYIDSMNYHDIVGTIAGDDTIFILMRTEAEAKSFSEKFAKELNL